MKKHFLAGLLVWVAIFSCNLQDSFAKTNGGLEFRSEYVAGMVGATIVDEPVFQPYLGVDLGENFSANAWLSVHASESWRIRKGDELDLYLCYDSSFGEVSNMLSLLYYDLYPVSISKGDLFAVKDVVKFPVGSAWNCALAFEWEIPEDSKVLEGGLFYKAEFSRNMLKVGNSDVVGTLTFGGHDGAYGLKPEAVSFARGTVSTSIPVQSVIITPTLMLQWGNGGLARNEIVVGVGMKF